MTFWLWLDTVREEGLATCTSRQVQPGFVTFPEMFSTTLRSISVAVASKHSLIHCRWTYRVLVFAATSGPINSKVGPSKRCCRSVPGYFLKLSRAAFRILAVDSSLLPQKYSHSHTTRLQAVLRYHLPVHHPSQQYCSSGRWK